MALRFTCPKLTPAQGPSSCFMVGFAHTAHSCCCHPLLSNMHAIRRPLTVTVMSVDALGWKQKNVRLLSDACERPRNFFTYAQQYSALQVTQEKVQGAVAALCVQQLLLQLDEDELTCLTSTWLQRSRRLPAGAACGYTAVVPDLLITGPVPEDGACAAPPE